MKKLVGYLFSKYVKKIFTNDVREAAKCESINIKKEGELHLVDCEIKKLRIIYNCEINCFIFQYFPEYSSQKENKNIFNSYMANSRIDVINSANNSYKIEIRLFHSEYKIIFRADNKSNLAKVLSELEKKLQDY